jgi:perosamine synthetase
VLESILIEKSETKAMTVRIKLADPGIDIADKEAAIAVLDSGQLVNGPRCRALEDELRRVAKRRHAIVVSSGTTALLAAMKALGVGPKSTVIVPAFTFPAPAAAAAFLGARVRVCDVDPDTFCISPETLEPKLDDSISLVVAIDQFGAPAPVPKLEELLKSRGVPVLVDAACSIGSTLGGRPCGSFGAAAIFSFHPRKVVTTGEGGAVLTDYDTVASRIRQIVDHGIEEGKFASTGLNLRLSEIAAAIGQKQLERLNSILKKRRELAAGYRALPLKFQKPPQDAEVNHQTLVAVLPEELGESDRQNLIDTLKEQGIQANIASYCLGEVPAIARQLEITSGETPVSQYLHERGVAMPLHVRMSGADVEEVVKVVQSWINVHGKK